MWRCKDVNAIRKISLPWPSRKATQQLKPYFCCNLIFKNWPQTLSMPPLAFRALALWQKHVALCDLYREHYTTVYKAMLYLIWRPSHISNISSHLNRVWPNECIAVLCFAVIAPQPPSNTPNPAMRYAHLQTSFWKRGTLCSPFVLPPFVLSDHRQMLLVFAVRDNNDKSVLIHILSSWLFVSCDLGCNVYVLSVMFSSLLAC